MATKRMDLNNSNSNRTRIGSDVNPNNAYSNTKPKRPLTDEEKRKYLEAQKRYSSKPEHKDPIEVRRETSTDKIKDRSNIADSLFKILKNSLLELENIYGLNEKVDNGKRIKDLPIKEFHSIMAKRVSKMPLVKRHELCSKAAPAIAHLQVCLNYMEYYSIVKIRFEPLVGCEQICQVMQMLKVSETKNDAIRNMNKVLTALHRNDLKGERAVSVPSYRFVRMLCVFVMFKDAINASVFSRMIFGQAILEQELNKRKGKRKGDLDNVRQANELWANVEN